MKLKKKLRAFFTLARKGDGGFTLVELIVVIAILAILGGIGTVGYSAYVTKANESADRQMIADVEQALILGAYSKLLDTNETLTVGLSRNADATAFTNDVNEIMVAAFGENWEQALRLKSDLCENNYGKVYQLISENPEMFSSVPSSSFYGTEGNTTKLVADVDEMVGALYGVLGGNSYAFSNFWGDDFHATVKEGGLGETWNSADNAQMAANLTVFAAANKITNVMTGAQNGDTSASTTLNNWTASWTGDTKEVTIGDAYVADLVMQYAQCNAVYNYTIANVDPEDDDYDTVVGAYTALESQINNMQNTPDNVSNLTVFNNAVSDFWKLSGKVRTVWQSSGQAQKDAEALLATMAALNTLESDYVNAGQTELLNSSNAFAQAGAADVLDGMVAAANTNISGEWIEWMVVVKVVDGTPTVQFGLPEE